jgi:hypothetical protein
MPSGMPDSAPEKAGKGRGHVGMRNNDGREGGSDYDSSEAIPSRKKWGIVENSKDVGVEPNNEVEGLLLKQGTKGLGQVVE